MPDPASAAGVRTVLALRACDGGIQGPENLILALGRQLRRSERRYVVGNLWDGEPPRVALHEQAVREGLESHVLASSSPFDPALFGGVADLVRRIRPDVIHSHDVKSEVVGVVVGRRYRIAHAASFYGRLTMRSLRLKTYDSIGMLAFRFADRVLANSRAQYEELLRWRVPAHRISVLASFVDATAMRPPTPEEAAAARLQFGVGADQPVIATVARLSVNKGHLYALRAFARVKERVPDAVYLVAGEGDSVWHGEGGHRAVLEREARALGLGDSVRFLGYHPDARTVLFAADVVVSASLREGMQVALLEAMATGLPVVATAVGGSPDAVVHGETGYLVPPADPESLARAVVELLEMPERGRAMGRVARRRVEERFDVAAVADQFLSECALAVVARGRSFGERRRS